MSLELDHLKGRIEFRRQEVEVKLRNFKSRASRIDKQTNEYDMLTLSRDSAEIAVDLQALKTAQEAVELLDKGS